LGYTELQVEELRSAGTHAFAARLVLEEKSRRGSAAKAWHPTAITIALAYWCQGLFGQAVASFLFGGEKGSFGAVANWRSW